MHMRFLYHHHMIIPVIFVLSFAACKVNMLSSLCSRKLCSSAVAIELACEILMTVFIPILFSMLLSNSSINSPEKIKLKPSPRKRQGKKGSRERNLYRKNYFHAWESLLSVLFNKQRGKTAVLSLKKSGPELSELLTQFSAGIAGTGLAVIFSVMCKVAVARVPFCASKLLNTGFGFGLVWLSGAVNKLRETVVYVTKNSSKVVLNEDEVAVKVDRSVNEIFFRAATVMAVAALRFV